MPDTDTKDEDSSAVTPDQIATAKNQAVSKLFADAFDARNNVIAYKNQQGTILQRNAGLEAQFKAAQERRAYAHAAVQQAKELAEGLDKEVDEHKKKLDGLKKGLTEFEEAIKKLEVAKVPVDELNAGKAKLAAEIAEEEKAVAYKKRTIAGHQATAEAKTQEAATQLSGEDHQSAAMQQLQQIATQIEFNQKQSEDKQKKAEEAQAMSDEDWFKVPENRKALKTLLGDALSASQQAAMKAEDDAVAANAKKQADFLVPDSEIKALHDMVATNKLVLQVAMRLPDSHEHKMDDGKVTSHANQIDQDMDSIDKKRTELSAEAATAEGGDSAAKEAFQAAAAELRQEVREFRQKYGTPPTVDFASLKVDPSVAADLKAMNTKAQVSIRGVLGQDPSGMRQAMQQLVAAKMVELAETLSKSPPANAPTKGEESTWQPSVFAFLEKRQTYDQNVGDYKKDLQAVIDLAPGTAAKNQLKDLLSQIASYGTG